MADTGDDDTRLMLRVRDGDAGAFEELVRRHQRSLVNLVYRYLGRSDRAEDGAQDVFLKIYQARTTWRPEAKFTTWMYRIAVNHCLNVIRDRAKERAESLSTEDGDRELRDPRLRTPTDLMRQGELREAVRRALDRLPPNQRMAVLLYRYHEMSYREIAEALDTTEKAVKSLLARSKDNLKDHLKRWID